MPLLHGKSGPQHVCRTCSDECVSWEGIFCVECGNWYHVKCEQLEIQILQAFKEAPEVPYICRICRSDDRGVFSYTDSLQRLHKAANCSPEQLNLAAEREKLLMKDNLNYSTVKNPRYTLDQISQDLLKEHVPGEKRRTIRVTRDNNSLFSAVSVALCGSEKLATELRVRCCIEMVLCDAYYRWQKNYTKMSECAPDYTESCINCATPNEDSCVWTLSALATVVRRPIRSIYPAVNGDADRAVKTLNTVFHPRSKVEEGEELRIFWSSSLKIEKISAGSWVPDIFVPLINVSTVQLSPMVSMQATPSRISGRMRKPTPKVMAITTGDKKQLQVVVHEYDSDASAHDDSDADQSDEDEVIEDMFSGPKLKAENIDLSWMEKYTHTAIGGKPLRGTNFLPAQEVFNELTSTVDVLPSIPTGRKEDVFFIVDNSRNLKYRHRRNYYSDDCGCYNQKSGTTCKSYYLLTSDNRLVPLIKNKDKYCRESKRVSLSGGAVTPRGRGRPPGRRGRGRPRLSTSKEDRVTQWIPMEPQPEEEEIIVLNRYYSSLEVDPTYKRRISWFSNLPKMIETGQTSCLVEYLTKAPPGIQLPANRKVITNISLAADDEEEEEQQVDETEGSREEEMEENTADKDSDEKPADTAEAAVTETPDVCKEPGDEASAKNNTSTVYNKNADDKSAKSLDKAKSPSETEKTPEAKSLIKSLEVKQPVKPKSPGKAKELDQAGVGEPAATKETATKTDASDRDGENAKKRHAEPEVDGGRGKRRKVPSIKARESGSQANFDSDED